MVNSHWNETFGEKIFFFVFTFDEAEADDGPGRAEAEHQLPLETAHVGPAGLLVQP